MMSYDEERGSLDIHNIINHFKLKTLEMYFYFDSYAA